MFFISPLVSFREVDLSDVVPSVSSAIAGMVVRANRGPLEKKLISTNKQYKEAYCVKSKLEPTISDHYVACSFLERKGAALYVRRAVNTGVTYGGVSIVRSDSTATNTVFVSGITLNNTLNGPTTWVPITDEVFAIRAADPGLWNNNLSVKISEVDTTDYTFKLEVFETIGTTVYSRISQVMSRVSDKLDGYGRNIFIENILAKNPYVRIINNTNTASTVLPKAQATSLAFTGGLDGAIPTVGQIGNCWDEFNNPDEIDISILIHGNVGGATVAQKMDIIANSRKDCMAFIDVDPAQLLSTDVVNWRNATLNVDSSYSALFGPSIEVYDWDNDVRISIPASGFAAGLAAENDFYNKPWYMFAGENRGIINVLGLSSYYGLVDRDLLSKNGANIFRKKPGRFLLSDNKTLQKKESALSFIEVRRTLLVLEKAIASYAEYFLFEPLVEVTRQRFVAAIEDYLRTVKAGFGIYDYKIVCDQLGSSSGNNPPYNIDLGQLNCDIYLKMVHAIRGIQLSAVLMRTGASFEEKVTLG